MTSVAPNRVSSFAAKAAATATNRQNNTATTGSDIPQIDRVVESVANANKRLSQTSTISNSKRKAENKIGPWRLGRTLGRGSTGRVRLAKHCVTGQLSAVKIVPKAAPGTVPSYKKGRGPKIDPNGLPYGIEREIIIMKLISHSNIMALYDVWENENELYLVLEYVEGGELFDFLINRGRLSEREAVGYFKQIIRAVEYCHKFDICHRDLKPENILLDKNHNIKIADFGMAALETKHRLLETSCGSPHYASPEIVAGRTYHGSPSDVWSCGIIFFALLTGHLPFDDSNIRKLLLKVQTGKFHMPANLSNEAKDLIWSMLRVDPRNRISIHDILQHPLLRKYPDTEQSLPVIEDVDERMSKPIKEIDPDILHNLQTLWHGIPINELVKNLQNGDQNPEKMFYYLLEKYKEDHIENPNESSKQSRTRRRPPSPIKSAKLGITKSTSIRTIIQDENGEVLKMTTKEMPRAPTKALPKKPSKSSINSKNRAPAMVVSSTLNKSVSFNKRSSSKLSKASRSSSKSSLAKSKKLTVNPKNLPKLPEIDLSEFTYMVNAVFPDDEPDLNLTFDIYDDSKTSNPKPERSPAKRSMSSIQKVVTQPRMSNMDDQAFKSSLDPKLNRRLLARKPVPQTISRSGHRSGSESASDSASESIRKTSDVLQKFGVKMDLDGFETQRSTPKKQAPSKLTRKSSIVTSHSSSKNLSSYLSPLNDISMNDYNKKTRTEAPHYTKLLPAKRSPNRHKTHKPDVSVDESIVSYANSYSLHSAIQIPILTPMDEKFKVHPFEEDKFADAENENGSKIISSQSNQSILRPHRIAESAPSHDSHLNKFVQQPFPTIRCSLMANSNYDMPPEDGTNRKRMTLTPEKAKKIETVKEEPARASIFADPQIEQPFIVHDETTIFDDETTEKSQVVDLTRQQRAFRRSSNIKERIVSLLPRRESLGVHKVDNSPIDPNFEEREARETANEIATETKQKRPNWFKRFIGTLEWQPEVSKKKAVPKFKRTRFWKKQHYIESDILTNEQVINGLRNRLEHQSYVKLRPGRNEDVLNVEYIGNSRKNGLHVTVETDRQDGYEYGFSGCVVVMTKNSGSNRMFKLSCTMMDQFVREMEMTKND
ncbi:hypothetical protein OGAPHI_006386 [Ogataea philodendri]|uniref:non-specific serine/threonine protein kinase n=1 Tax=Ogataea philodendri TaxID=1378263 RepID=A0A9P8NWF1_9ASCO|nr:uncharacterized protein OGAPHI_006386 [Ogataea philodendri]KAH3661538.1 hypothetical protein OGAPHI_006386 [Ogataea philodendri]